MTRPGLGARFHVWLAAALVSELGTGLLTFALTWTATGHGPHAAAWVATCAVAPPVLCGLLGGAVADRYGARATMIAGDLAMVVVCAGLVLASVRTGDSLPSLLGFALLSGLVAAFYRPAAGVFPRWFAAPDQLGMALARVGMTSQIARSAAPPLGGILVAAVHLSGVAVINLLTYTLMAATLVAVRPTRTPRPDGADTNRRVGAALRAARHTPGVPALLVSVAALAGGVLPAVYLCIPLAARERGWSAVDAGLIEAGWIAGGLVLSGWYAWRGPADRPRRALTAGPLVVALGLGILAAAGSPTLGIAGTTIAGAGVVVFTAQAFPTYLRLAPEAMVSRFQSLLILVQQAPMLAANLLAGAVVAGTGTTAAILATGGIAAAAAVVVRRDPSLATTGSARSPESRPARRIVNNRQRQAPCECAARTCLRTAGAPCPRGRRCRRCRGH